jgi:hypothetical protein
MPAQLPGALSAANAEASFLSNVGLDQQKISKRLHRRTLQTSEHAQSCCADRCCEDVLTVDAATCDGGINAIGHRRKRWCQHNT